LAVLLPGPAAIDAGVLLERERRHAQRRDSGHGLDVGRQQSAAPWLSAVGPLIGVVKCCVPRSRLALLAAAWPAESVPFCAKVFRENGARNRCLSHSSRFPFARRSPAPLCPPVPSRLTCAAAAAERNVTVLQTAVRLSTHSMRLPPYDAARNWRRRRDCPPLTRILARIDRPRPFRTVAM
jgi:hypothetical protein